MLLVPESSQRRQSRIRVRRRRVLWRKSAVRHALRCEELNLRFFVRHFLDIFRAYYGPMLKAFEALEEVAGKALARDIIDLVGRFNTSIDETVVVPSEYLEVVIAKR